MDLIDKIDQGIIKGICRRELRYIYKDKDRFNRTADRLDLQPRGFVERTLYFVGYLLSS
jgi:hypothetical protein